MKNEGYKTNALKMVMLLLSLELESDRILFLLTNKVFYRDKSSKVFSNSKLMSELIYFNEYFISIIPQNIRKRLVF